MSVRDDSLWAMAAENLSNSSQLPELDLHGLAVHVAMVELESFLNSEFMAGTEAVKIICGIGTGVLLNNTKKLLTEYRSHGLVEDFVQVKSGGVLIVRLSENK
ncbi:MAG: Smr/MutS family protein [Candidatus Doudnabacteria bacterium]|jgi:DNA-nicking Smr family endonuclease